MSNEVTCPKCGNYYGGHATGSMDICDCHEAKDPFVVNGKRYSLWPKFVVGKAEWIGGEMQEYDPDFGFAHVSKITNIRLEPNGKQSAMLWIDSDDYSWGADVQYLHVVTDHIPGFEFSFGGYGGSKCSIRKPKLS